MRAALVLALVGLVGSMSLAAFGAAGASSDRRIAFTRAFAGRHFTYTANTDGSNVKRLVSSGLLSSDPRWSPDGRHVAVLAGCTDGAENCAFTIVDASTGRIRQAKMSDPGLFTACHVWSPNGRRFA